MHKRNYRNKRSNKSRRRNNRRGGSTRTGAQLITEINNKPILTRCVRFSSNTGNVGTSLFYSQDLLTSVGGHVTSGATTFYPIADSIQLIRVGITLLPDTSSSSGTVTFTWNGLNAPEVRETMFYSNAIPMQRSFRPVEATTAWLWWNNTATNTPLFSIRNQEPTGVVVLVDLELKYIQATGAVTSVTLTQNCSFTGIGYRELPIGVLEFSPVDLDTVY